MSARSMDRDLPMYTINELLDTLSSHDNDEAYSFVSDLTGFSEDTIYELYMEEQKRKKGKQNERI